MTLAAIKNQVMFQTNNDREDLPDFEPHLTDYINEGYDLLVLNYTGKHVSAESNEYEPLTRDRDEPNLPEYAHRALVDYSTYLVYRNGNAVKQNRGMAFYSAFLQTMSQLKFESDSAAGVVRRQFKNIYSR